MVRTTLTLALFSLLALGLLVARSAEEKTLAPAEEGFKATAAFLQSHCVKCHNADKQAGKVRLDDMTADVGKDIDRWLGVREQIRDGAMPPEKEPRPDATQARQLVAWIEKQTSNRAARLPNDGNRIPHELLFSTLAKEAAPSLPRLWRLSPEGYHGFIREMRGPTNGIVQPFTLVQERGIKDFAGLYTIDEPATEILLRNAELIIDALTGFEIKDGKLHGKGGQRDFLACMDPATPPSRAQLETAVQTMFKTALGRPAPADEVERYLALYEKCLKVSDRPGAVRTMLQAIVLRTDAMFRTELGRGPAAGAGRRLLSPEELAQALSLALGDRREPSLWAAAQKGELTSPAQVAEQVRRVLGDPKVEKPRLLKFFREYFEYGKAVDVFKDHPKDFMHEPRTLVSDTDRLILHILENDKQVLRELLTTDRSFVNYTLQKDRKTKEETAKPAVVPHPINNRGQKGPEWVYNVETWPSPQPAPLPKETRIGILMQPSWLAAHATNFDNDPVRRGRWVRERLLGGSVPDLPLGVAAQVPDDKHRTFRARLEVTREAKCWKCHRFMDDLGLPFEQFDDFGRFRTTERVLDLEATEKNVDKKGKKLGPVYREAPLDTTGVIASSGDPQLDGPVANPRDMMQRLAGSDRVRQVFVRHVFRFFLGRNETLSDARTLQEADRAYVESGGSFKALVVSLLTSDAFLYRAAPVAPASSGATP